nr:vacuolar protein sorting-associated protein 41 homolog [Tanacetum cinerariifolium]
FDVAVLQLPEFTVVAGLMTMAVPTHMARKRHAFANVTNQRPQNESNLGNAQRPEGHVVTWNNDELATDALPVLGFEHYKVKDYSLAHVPFTGSSYAGGQWAAGDEPLYYVVSQKDIVIAKPRDAEDHINWLLQHRWHEKALAAIEVGQGRNLMMLAAVAGIHGHCRVDDNGGPGTYGEETHAPLFEEIDADCNIPTSCNSKSIDTGLPRKLQRGKIPFFVPPPKQDDASVEIEEDSLPKKDDVAVANDKSSGAKVHPSPLNLTGLGQKIFKMDPSSSGSLGIAIFEAIEMASIYEDTKCFLGSVLDQYNVLLLHTISRKVMKDSKEALMSVESVEVDPRLSSGCGYGGGGGRIHDDYFCNEYSVEDSS